MGDGVVGTVGYSPYIDPAVELGVVDGTTATADAAIADAGASVAATADDEFGSMTDGIANGCGVCDW